MTDWLPKPKPLRTLTDEQVARWEESYLEHIFVFFRDSDPDYRTLRTFLDSWYAYSRANQTLLDDEGKPVWLNSPSPFKADTHDALPSMHLISPAARAVLQAGLRGDPILKQRWERKEPDSRLVKEHSVPVAEILRRGRKAEITDPSKVRHFLCQIYRVAIITKEEDNRFSRRKQSFMPDQWEVGDDPFARYNGIIDLKGAVWPALTEKE